MIVTKSKERPKYELVDDKPVEVKRSEINRAEPSGCNANDVFTQFYVDVKPYYVKDAIVGITDEHKGGLPYIMITYNDARTEQFVFNHKCAEVKLSSALSEDGKMRQYAVWCWNWPGDFKEIEITVQNESDLEKE